MIPSFLYIYFTICYPSLAACGLMCEMICCVGQWEKQIYHSLSIFCASTFMLVCMVTCCTPFDKGIRISTYFDRNWLLWVGPFSCNNKPCRRIETVWWKLPMTSLIGLWQYMMEKSTISGSWMRVIFRISIMFSLYFHIHFPYTQK